MTPCILPAPWSCSMRRWNRFAETSVKLYPAASHKTVSISYHCRHKPKSQTANTNYINPSKTEGLLRSKLLLRTEGFLEAVAKLQKAASSFVMSVRPHGTTRPPFNGFSWNLIFDYFSKICRENSSFIKSYKINRYFTWRPVYILFTTLMHWLH